MTDDEWRAFLREGTRTGKLGVVRKDGRPHVVPVWFLLEDDDTIVFTTGAHTVKGHALRRDPRVSLCVDDDRPPYAYVMVEGEATLSDDLGEVLRYATRLGARYMGDEVAEEFGRRNAVEGELLVRVRPVRVRGHADIAA
jgi:PPOX class probable F420-dependent enzyme